MKKKILILSSCIIGIPIAAFVTLLLLLTITDYKPKAVLPLDIVNNKAVTLEKGKVFSITTFNVGYCGMDENQDFFMDGGKGSRSSSKAKTEENLKGIADFLLKENSDFNLLQEVDVSSTRSFRVNEYDYLTKLFSDYSSVFAYNYKVLWVPVPLPAPHGNVNGGLMTLTRFNTLSAARYQYPGLGSWPTRLADLKRCFIESRLPVKGGKELVLVNSHLSAYDKGGVIRKQQLAFLKTYIENEYSKGNYVLVGGDWNHEIPGTDPYKFKAAETWPDWLQKIPNDFKPQGFKWAYDASVPSNRTVATKYIKDKNFLDIIDGFLVSPNIEIQSVKGHSLGFKYTDHNPVTGKLILK